MAFSIKDFIYQAAPVFLQNSLISIYGQRLYKQRYSGIYSDLLKEIEQVDQLTSEGVECFQIERMKALLLHAQLNIPYYKNLFNKIGFRAEDFKSMDDLNGIPPLEKETLRNNPELFKSTQVYNSTFFHQKTSGSTGKPIELEVDEKTYKRAMALLVHHEQQHGVRHGAARATFAGRMLQPVEDMSPPFSRYNKAENQRLFSAYHLNDDTIATYAQELAAFQPEEIIGYPSAIYLLAFLLQKHNIKMAFQPKLVVTNSETLLDWQKETIESVLGAPVMDYYGTAEYVVFANQCSHQQYHINPVLGYLEVVDSQNKPIFEHEGDVLCTTVSNYVMPLIRYRVGDRAIKNKVLCDCGMATESLSSVVGRIDDYLITLDNRKIGRLDHIYKGLQGIQEGQLIQSSRTQCSVKIVKADQHVVIDEQALKQNFKERMGEGIDLAIDYVDAIPKNKNGKFKAVLNLLE